MPNDNRTSGLLIKLSLALASFILSIVLIEFGLRYIARGSLNLDQFGSYHPILGHVNPPSVDIQVNFPDLPAGVFPFKTNAAGLREEAEIPQEKPEGEFRILVTGDSQTSGVTENELSFPNQLEKIIRDETNQPVEVINAGVGAYSPLQNLMWFNLYGIKYQPDILIFTIYSGNDFADLIYHPFETLDIVDNQFLLDGKILTPQKRSLNQFLEKSYLYTLINAVIQQGTSGSPTSPVDEARKNCGGCFWQQLWQVYQFKNQPGMEVEQIEKTMTILDVLQNLCNQNNIELVVLYIPSRGLGEGAIQEEKFLQAQNTLALTHEDIQIEQKLLESAFQQTQAKSMYTINAMNRLNQSFQNNQEPLYYPTDMHLTPAGNQVVAQTLWDYLAGIKLLDK